MWKVDAATARFDSPELAFHVDVARPQRGMHDFQLGWQGKSQSVPDAAILCAHLSSRDQPENVVDTWTRGADLVVVYDQSPQRPFRSEIYWRVLDPHGPFRTGVELIVSVQTSLLDALPQLTMSSSLPASTATWVLDPARLELARSWQSSDPALLATSDAGHGIFLLRSESLPFSYVEMVYPADFVSAALRGQAGRTELQWQFFPESLEKGVIRRARLRCLFIGREGDVAWAADCYRDFVASPTPLTS
jgi:hypothetical protein